MTLVFEWDGNKAKINKRKHGVGFDEAQTIFTDDLSVIKPDVEHSNTEERLLIIGTSNKNRLIVVSYTEREDIIRLINARKATRNERKQYEEDHF
jgi:uncharacterized DUF497 family protein